LAGFVQSLRASWFGFLLRFTLAFVLLAFGWLAVAPAYAEVLAMLGRPLIPVLETMPGSAYTVEGATVWAVRVVPAQGTRPASAFRAEVWKGYANYDLILLAALILATPRWSLRRKGRLLVLGLALLTLAEIAFFVVTIEYSQARPVPIVGGGFLPPGFSRPWQILFTWVYYFFETMGRSLFPLLVYWGMLGTAWRPLDSRAPARAPGRNDPCTCGSGKKYKRCCGK
jgi:hypothetical protein